MAKTVFALHTSFALVDVLKPLYAELLPGVRIVNVVDDSLLADVRAAGGLIPSVTRRLIGYGILAESAGADVLFSCCSSVGDAIDALRLAVTIPVVKIDEAMAAAAVDSGGKAAVIATVPTTLAPTERLILRKAEELRKTVHVRQYLAEGAFDALMAGNSERHDELLTDQILSAAGENDVVVLAQGSMARLVPQLQGRTRTPILSSLRSGVESLGRSLEAR